jgi:hypothetical protein
MFAQFVLTGFPTISTSVKGNSRKIEFPEEFLSTWVKVVHVSGPVCAFRGNRCGYTTSVNTRNRFSAKQGNFARLRVSGVYSLRGNRKNRVNHNSMSWTVVKEKVPKQPVSRRETRNTRKRDGTARIEACLAMLMTDISPGR